VHSDGRFDVPSSAVVLVGYAVSSFLFAIMLVVLFAGGVTLATPRLIVSCALAAGPFRVAAQLCASLPVRSRQGSSTFREILVSVSAVVVN